MPVSGTLATLRLAARAKIVRFWETVGYVGQTEVEGGGRGELLAAAAATAAATAAVVVVVAPMLLLTAAAVASV